MKTEPTNQQLPPRFLRFIVEKILPRALHGDYAGALNEGYKSLWKFVPESVATVATGYRIQAIGAFNKTAFVAEIGAVVFCFAAASLSLPLFIVLGAVLGALTLRDAYTHPHQGSAVKRAEDAATEANATEKRRPESRYYLDSAGDAATAAVFLLLSQALMLQVSPPLAVPGTVLFRGALVCLPLLSILRMVLRARPQKTMRFEGSSKMSARAIYRMTWRLNILWMTACLGTILTNPHVMPAFIPGHDFLVGFIPAVTFGVWIRLQSDALSHDDIGTVLGDRKKKELVRMIESLIKSVDKYHPLYLVYVGLEALFFLWLAMPSAVDLWPWLSGGKADGDVLRLGSNVVAFATLVLSWSYVKNSNRAAARAIQEEIDASDAAKKNPVSA